MNRVQQYLIQDLDDFEKEKHWEYILEHNIDAFQWIEKSSKRRDELLQLDLRCLVCKKQGNNQNENHIHITERGICKCSLGHDCIEYVEDYIRKHL